MAIKKFRCGICKEVYWRTRKGLKEHLKEHIRNHFTNVPSTGSKRQWFPTEQTKQSWWISEEMK